MNTFNKRFNEAFKRSGLSQHQLADLVKVSQPAIKKLVSGETKSFRKIAELARALNVDLNWLSSGKVNNNQSSNINNTLAQRIKSRREKLGLTQEQVSSKAGITRQSYQQIESGEVNNPRYLYEISIALECDMAWLLSGKEELNVTPVIINSNKVPLISYVQAGLWSESCELRDSTGFEYILTSLELSEHAFALNIKGRSMEPLFNEGDTIIIDPAIHPLPGDYVVAQNGEAEATFKKYRELGYDEYERMQFELIPLNDDYPKMSTLTQQIRIIGTMVEHRTYYRRR